MSSSMMSVQIASNPAHTGNHVHGAGVQVFGTLNGTPLNGFVVLDSAGEFQAWAADFGTAKKRLDAEYMPGGYVERCSDGERMANAPQRRVRPV